MTAEDAVSVQCRGSSSPFHLSPAGFKMKVVENNEFFEALGTEMYCQGYKTRQCKASLPRAELVGEGGVRLEKMHQEPCNTYADIQAPQFWHSHLKTVLQSLLQRSGNTHLFWGEEN